MIECKPLSRWARSSMVEQRPFKPFVEGSIPSALTGNPPFLEGFCYSVRKHPAMGCFFLIFIFVQFEFIQFVEVFQVIFIQRQKVEFIQFFVEIQVFERVFKEGKQVFVFCGFDQA